MSATLIDAINARFFAESETPKSRDEKEAEFQYRHKISRHLGLELDFWDGPAAPKMSPMFVVRFAAATGLLGGLHEDDLHSNTRVQFEWNGLLDAYEEGVTARRAIEADKTTVVDLSRLSWWNGGGVGRDILREHRRAQEAQQAESAFYKRQAALAVLHPEVEELRLRVEQYEAMLAKSGLL